MDVPSLEEVGPNISELLQRIECLEEQVRDGKTAFASLSVEVAELKLQTNQSEFVKSIQILPVYDYALIKARKNLLHQEYRSMYRVFSRMIRMHYDTPMAVAVVEVAK